MAAVLRGNWAAPAEPRALPPAQVQDVGQAQFRPPPQRNRFSSTSQKSPQTEHAVTPPYEKDELIREISLEKSGWTPPIKTTSGQLVRQNTLNKQAWASNSGKSKSVEFGMTPSAKRVQPKLQQQDEQNSMEKTTESLEEPEVPPGACMLACERFGETMAEFLAEWFGAVHLQHLSADDVQEHSPHAAAARELREKATASGMSWSNNFHRMHPKVHAAHMSLSSSLKATLGGTGKSNIGLGNDVVEIPEDAPAPLDQTLKLQWGFQEDEALLTRQYLPFFSVCQCLFCFFLWVICRISSGQDMAGFETIWPGRTDLALQWDCESYQVEVFYRWWTHQFTHIGFMHVFMNCVMTLFFGINLEGVHGWWRMALMFNVGVLGGACCYMVSDVHTRVVGMSGGCYALVGMHFGDVLMNFTEQRRAAEHFAELPPEQKTGVENLWRRMIVSPVKKIACLVIMVAIDLLQAYLTLGGQTSHSVHFGGFVAGFLICIVVGHNLVVQGHELFFWVAALATGVGLMIFCISWGSAWPPRDIFDSTPWCWGRQVANRTIFQDNAWHCVRCADHACIARWSVQRHIEMVSDRVCRQALGWEITER